MSLESILIGLFTVGFPLLLIFFQWILIRRRLPWLGMLVGLILPFLFWLLYLLVITPKSADCKPSSACEWVGLGFAVITIYAAAIAALSTLVSLAIQLVYRKRIWGPDEMVKKTGKIPALVLAVAMLMIIIYFALSITGLLYRFTIPGEGPYP